MKARICFTETGTGEGETFDCEINDLSLESVVDAVMRFAKHMTPAEHHDDIELVKGEAFVIQGNKAAFILSSHDKVWFGNTLWHGVVYTLFAGEAEVVI